MITNLKKIISKYSNYYFLLFLFFFIFTCFYILNFEKYNNLFSTDFVKYYKPTGLMIINNILNLEFNKVKFLDFYLLPTMLTGIFIKLTPNELLFSILSNFFNILILFFSLFFFLKTFVSKNKNRITFVFLTIFFMYIANWEWCFWKLPDIYFLFIFSLVFYFLYQAIQKNNHIKLIYALLFSILSMITKPQGIITIPLIISSLFFLKYYKKNFFKIILISSIIYLIFFTLFIFILTKLNIDNIAVKSFINGKITWNISYTYSQFIEQFSLIENNTNQFIYYYYLILKKLIYQITFIRETYSLEHNTFLICYLLIIYFSLIINFEYLTRKYNIFLKLTILTTFITFVLYCSLFSGSEPNRFQLFYLVPVYILVSISIDKFLDSFTKK